VYHGGAHGAALTICWLRGREHLSAISIMHGAALTRCRLRRGREHLSAFSMRCAWGSTYTLSVEEGKGAFVSIQHHAWGSTYFLSVEEGKGAFVNIQHAVRMGQHLQSVG
jgi:hypothetical protein